MPKRAIWICGLFAVEMVLIMLAFQVLASVDYAHLMSYDGCRGSPCRHATLDAATAHVQSPTRPPMAGPRSRAGRGQRGMGCRLRRRCATSHL